MGRVSIIDDERAVSPVIATVLLLAITVMLSSMVFVMMQGALTSVEKSSPEASVSVRGLSNGFHVVRLTSLDQALDPSQLEYQLISGDGEKLSGLVSDSDVYGVIGSNVSFHDRDAGYSVTKGDYFVIDSNSIGSDNGEWKLKLIDLSSNTLLFDTQLSEIEY
ncbi:MAG: type IV pilin [Euryarchaeota archaeon TMED248]|nr:MAG: type IV pilin [Euryarchaeota archaeon TMED248]|tara:strand:- start:21338 stop:21826 length:489 start_codon:yes stop_codon:yes gene_type:complete